VQKQAADIRQQYLTDQSEEYTGIHKIPTEQALWAILHAENSRKTYKQICGIIGHKKDRYPLAEIEVIDPGYQYGRIITLTNQKEVNEAIHCLNQNHTRQQLQMLFASISSLAQDIDPENSSNIISRILDGECIDIIYEELLLSDIEKQWTWELTWKMDEEVGNHATIQDFINFLKQRKEKCTFYIRLTHRTLPSDYYFGSGRHQYNSWNTNIPNKHFNHSIATFPLMAM
jgi:hypothetical protein